MAFANGNQTQLLRPSEIAIYSARLPAPSRPFHEHILLNLSFYPHGPFLKTAESRRQNVLPFPFRE